MINVRSIMRFSALCAVAACAGCVQAQGPHREVRTEGGLVRGAVGTHYVAYLGVPYAAPPVGDNRFKDPLPPPSWEGVYEANRTTHCPYNGAGDEDCLLLHVFAPAEPRGGPSPVLVYIHGGSGQTAGAEHLTREGLVVVTINHRLGVLGFLCLGTEDAPGNAGLKDQAAALRWVRRNIAGFGGDPRRVTLYGMSAGGASVDLQILSHMSKGLFRTAIVESGSATSFWAIDPDPIDTAFTLAKTLGFPETKNLTQLVEYFREVPALTLSKHFGPLPCVEREIPNVEAFMTESPYKILTEEKYDKLPMMVFYTALEGLFLLSEEYYKQNYKEMMEASFVDFFPSDLVFESPEIKQEVAQTVRQHYFGNDTTIEVMGYLHYFGDSLIIHGLLNSVEVHSKANNPVYLMEFSYKGQMGSYEPFYKNFTIAGHGDVVKHALLIKPITNESDRRTVERVSKLVANYVKYGNPTPNQTELLPLTWPTYKPSDHYLYLDKEFQLLQHPMKEQKAFWDDVYRNRRRIVKAVDPTPYETNAAVSHGRVGLSDWTGILLLIVSSMFVLPILPTFCEVFSRTCAHKLFLWHFF